MSPYPGRSIEPLGGALVGFRSNTWCRAARAENRWPGRGQVRRRLHPSHGRRAKLHWRGKEHLNSANGRGSFFPLFTFRRLEDPQRFQPLGVFALMASETVNANLTHAN